MKKVYAREEVCIGCRLCEVYCAVEHSQSKDLVKAFKKEMPRPTARITVEEEGPLSFGFQCRHCDQPDCVYSCIAGALEKQPDGRVLVDASKCIGCWTCVLACRFGAITRDLEKGLSVKCDLCPDREVPACVENCPNEALVYGEKEGFSWLNMHT